MGRVIWLMGPSGAGKDTLLAALRQREYPQLLVAHRYITRPASAGSENYIALSEKEFFTRAEQHLFTLSWHANGFYYGIGAEIDLWLQAGFDVVVNGSRGHLAQAQAQYGSLLLPVYVQVSLDILRQRLEKRGRENAAEIAARLERAARYTPKACLTLNNDGSLLQSVEGLVKLIRTTQGNSA
ncbi:ribose 1,5-bisphosphokinase [Vagococcus sp. WN89Y]|uniref:ribose 1,5-bisphosphokinase n=1 Tax=Vagococcus sp. WN89Y TaxID=3457258 RepID=UPI003FCE3D78